MIPKVIHYCWFGENEKPEIVKKCIDSWKKYCPDWKICEWNEFNFDISTVPYMEEAYKMKKWAFVSDVARLMVVYQNGGVYLDTDVELLESIDSWLENDAFFAFESNRNINTGQVFGAIKHHGSVLIMLEYYKNRHFIINKKLNMIPCPAGNTDSLAMKYKDFKRNGYTQSFNNIKVLSYSDYSIKARHYGASTWVNNLKKRRKPYKETKLKLYLRDYQRVDFIEEHFGKRVTSIYIFLVYDLMENGFFYYFERMFNRVLK